MRGQNLALFPLEFAYAPGLETGEVPLSQRQRAALFQRYADKLMVNTELSRALVSFQANKDVRFYRWLKYKEAFSRDLVCYVLEHVQLAPRVPRRLLDPFAGIGTALTSAAEVGWQATGIELLPVGVATIRARLAADVVDIDVFRHHLSQLEAAQLDKSAVNGYRFPHLRITAGAFALAVEQALSAYQAFLDTISDDQVRFLFWFACAAILEEVSYTRKDGQYLRWDYRSGRQLKSTFKKEIVYEFKPAILHKLRLMLDDIEHRDGGRIARSVEITEGSCLDVLPQLPASHFGLVVTSPPYCNRYDYTRTYALELAYLGLGETEVRDLRQTLLSATVENKSKSEQIASAYRLRNQSGRYLDALRAFGKQEALQEALEILKEAGTRHELNNESIPGMVENYFFEMNLVIRELSRVLAPGGLVVMVNDNVRYHGEEIPVDLILSDFATMAGLVINCIWVLTRGKGNSSQQMGAYGRTELRKCVYVWSKPG